MNIIEAVREILQCFPKLSEMCGGVHVDFSDGRSQSCGLSSVGDEVLSEDIVGNLTKRHTFMFYTVFSSINDYERLINSSILIELGDWMRGQTKKEITTVVGNKSYSGNLKSLTSANGMIDEIPENNGISGVIYNLQIIADYTVNIE